ncbi:MAG TPA: hypothetical protein DDZ91_07900 [Firmicutes bacterium]|jgi:phosphate:Na+ symporter|nr:hypothetical protein [Bacillota bacterium]
MSALQGIIGLAGGLGLFLYGMKLCSEGLQKAAAHRLKQLVKILTKNSVRGVLVGALVTLGLQSSSATSAIVVGFTSANMMTLSQALSVLLGSAVGSSLTVHLIAFKLTYLALTLIFFGAIFYLFIKRSRYRSVGQILLGFGLIFYGMFVMSSAVEPVKDFPMVAQVIINLERYPLLAFLVAVIITAVLQSSAGFLALLITLARQGMIGPYALVPFVLGAHLGGTITGVISCLGVPGRESKRAGLANFLFKVVNGVVFLPFYRPITMFVLGSSPDVSRQIANAHTIFSLVMAIGFLPFTTQIANFMKRLIPDKAGGLAEAKYLKENLLEVPELAVDQAHRQTVEMGYIIYEEMLNQMLPLFRSEDEELFERFSYTEQAVDSLAKQIVKYVTTLDINNFSEDLLLRSLQVLYAANDLEHIGDLLLNIARIGMKITSEQLAFSEEGHKEIETLYNLTSNNFQQALISLEKYDTKLASRILKEHPKIRRYEKELRYSHFERMQSGNKRTLATSSLHLDMIESLLRIDNHTVNIAQGVVGIL